MTYNGHPWIMCSFNSLVIIWREGGIRLNVDVQGQGGGRMLDVVWTRGMGGLENWTVFKDVTCVSSLIVRTYSCENDIPKINDL